MGLIGIVYMLQGISLLSDIKLTMDSIYLRVGIGFIS